MLNGRESLADDIHHELPTPESSFAQLLYSLQTFIGDEPLEDETMSQQVISADFSVHPVWYELYSILCSTGSLFHL